MARVRWERWRKYYFEQTCRAIESENARPQVELPASERRQVPDIAQPADREDTRDAIQIARAAADALKAR